MAQVYKNFIGGTWVEAGSGQTFADRNPANAEDVLGYFPRSDARDVDAAARAAAGAFERWRRVPAPKRAEILFRAGEILLRKKEDLARTMTREMGKVLKESRGDVQEGIDMTYYIAGEGRRLTGQTTPSELPDKWAMSVRVPIGVVACITPWNFPLAIPTWKLAPALVAGNTVILKPAEDTPLLGHLLVEILLEAGLPPEVVQLVHGHGEEAGAPLVRHPLVNLVSFTGSSEVGQDVAVACAKEHRRCSLEMGGKNCILVMEDADLDLAVDGAIWGGFGTTGQRCTAASRVIVHEAVAREFTDALVQRATRLRLGDGLHPETEVGPVVNEAQLTRVHQYTEVGKTEGAELLCGGGFAREGALAKGYFYRPTVFAKVKPAMRIAQEEIFGPTVAVLPIRSFEEAVAVANGVRYGLSTAIYTRDVNRAFRAMGDLEAGITYVNAPTIGAEVHLPFGGVKATGNGHREGGPQVLDIFTEWKTIYVDYSGRLQRAQIDV